MTPHIEIIRVDPSPPRRLDEDCPGCGWADLWQMELLHLGDQGVSVFARVVFCARCGHRPRRP